MEDKHTTQNEQPQTPTSSGEDCHAHLRFNQLMVTTQHMVIDYKEKSSRAVPAKGRFEEMIFSLLRAKIDIKTVKETWDSWESNNYFIQKDLRLSEFDSTGNLDRIIELIGGLMEDLNDTQRDFKVDADIDNVFDAVESEYGDEEVVNLCHVIINEYPFRDELPSYQRWTADDFAEAHASIIG